MNVNNDILPLSPLDRRHHHRHLFSPGVLREEPQTPDSSLIDSPYPAVSQECSNEDDSETESVKEDSDTNKSPSSPLSCPRPARS